VRAARTRAIDEERDMTAAHIKPSPAGAPGAVISAERGCAQELPFHGEGGDEINRHLEGRGNGGA
ncbi:MAG: hypothetical protein ACRDJX_05320, partial [Solirubrobacteraceae bacterium]